MKQYCRYCAALIVGDFPYCRTKERFVSEYAAKRTNNCKDFEFCETDAFLENPRPYTPRKKKPPEPDLPAQGGASQTSFL